jgi:GNAT superfamily N-acetyltransferase
MAWIIDTLKLDIAISRKLLGPMATGGSSYHHRCGRKCRWLQTASTADSLFLEQLYLTARFQRQGIGSDVVRALIEEATRAEGHQPRRRENQPGTATL